MIGGSRLDREGSRGHRLSQFLKSGNSGLVIMGTVCRFDCTSKVCNLGFKALAQVLKLVGDIGEGAHVVVMGVAHVLASWRVASRY